VLAGVMALQDRQDRLDVAGHDRRAAYVAGRDAQDQGRRPGLWTSCARWCFSAPAGRPRSPPCSGPVPAAAPGQGRDGGQGDRRVGERWGRGSRNDASVRRPNHARQAHGFTQIRNQFSTCVLSVRHLSCRSHTGERPGTVQAASLSPTPDLCRSLADGQQ
jgi:hypothetical protein